MIHKESNQLFIGPYAIDKERNAGVIDDLWKIGKPTEKGGPLKNTPVETDQPSEPYLIGFYKERVMTLPHNSDVSFTFYCDVDPIGHGP